MIGTITKVDARHAGAIIEFLTCVGKFNIQLTDVCTHTRLHGFEDNTTEDMLDTLVEEGFVNRIESTFDLA